MYARKLIRGLCLSLLAIAGLSACSDNIKTQSDYRQEVDFSAFKSYAFLPLTQSDAQKIAFSRVEKALLQVLPEKSLSAASKDKADILIAYHLFVNSKESQRITNTSGVYYGRSIYGSGFNTNTSYVTNIEYQVGTLVIDIIDPTSNNIIWHGEASSVLHDSQTPEQRDALILSAVREVLRDFPPKATRKNE